MERTCKVPGMQDRKDPKEQKERNRTPSHSCWRELSGAKDDQSDPSRQTYRELEWEFRSRGVEPVDPLCGSFGEEGREESVISSMSEWEDADLGDFFFPKACLKELRNWIHKTIRLADAGPTPQASANRDMQKSKLLLPRSPPGHGKGSPQLSWISALREEELSGVDSSGDWSCGWHSMPTLGSRLDANSKTEPGSADDVGRRGWHGNKAGCSDTVTDAGEVSHINGWVSLVSHIHVGLAYLIDLPEKTQAKMGKGEEKRHIFNRESQRQGKLRTFQTWHGS